NGRSSPPRALPGHRAAPSKDVREQIAGALRATRATGQTARNRARGPCISQGSFFLSLGLSRPPRRHSQTILIGSRSKCRKRVLALEGVSLSFRTASLRKCRGRDDRKSPV